MHSSERWAAPPNHPHGETTFSLLLTYSQLGGSPGPRTSQHALQHGPRPGHRSERSRKGLTAGDTRTRQGAACAVSHPAFVFYSDPTSSETKNPLNWDFSYLGEGHKFQSGCFGAFWACFPGKGRLHLHFRRVTLLTPCCKVTACRSRGHTTAVVCRPTSIIFSSRKVEIFLAEL